MHDLLANHTPACTAVGRGREFSERHRVLRIGKVDHVDHFPVVRLFFLGEDERERRVLCVRGQSPVSLGVGRSVVTRSPPFPRNETNTFRSGRSQIRA